MQDICTPQFFKLLCPGLASQAAPQGRPRASVFGSKAGFEQFYIFSSSSISLLFRLRHLNCNIKNKTKNTDINVCKSKTIFCERTLHNITILILSYAGSGFGALAVLVALALGQGGGALLLALVLPGPR